MKEQTQIASVRQHALQWTGLTGLLSKCAGSSLPEDSVITTILRGLRTAESCAKRTVLWATKESLEQVILARTSEMRQNHSDDSGVVVIFLLLW